MTIAFGVLSASAGEPENLVLNAGNVEHINIQNDMDIILVQAPDSENAIVLDQKASDNLDLKLNNKTLYISEKRAGAKQKQVVYLYVNNLKTLTVKENCEVKTVGVLRTGKLDVFVDSNSKVHLKTTGQIKAHSLNDSTIEVKYLSELPVAKRGY
jgi:hypothetical protein